MGVCPPANLGFRQACSSTAPQIRPPAPVSSLDLTPGLVAWGFVSSRVTSESGSLTFRGQRLPEAVKRGSGKAGRGREGPRIVREEPLPLQALLLDPSSSNAIGSSKVEGRGVQGQGGGRGWLRGAPRKSGHPGPGRGSQGKLGGDSLGLLVGGVARELDLLPTDSLTLWSPGA